MLVARRPRIPARHAVSRSLAQDIGMIAQCFGSNSGTRESGTEEELERALHGIADAEKANRQGMAIARRQMVRNHRVGVGWARQGSNLRP